MHRRTLRIGCSGRCIRRGFKSRACRCGATGHDRDHWGRDRWYLYARRDRLTSVVNSNDLRIVPIVGKGSLQNIGDLLHLPGVDLALVAADALTYAQTAHLYPGELEKIQYICKLYENDVHVWLGRKYRACRTCKESLSTSMWMARVRNDCTCALEDAGDCTGFTDG